ncbi:MAG: TonB-dependent receptor domain-containing protein [Vulcanimicrobiaceae bacterium]
MTTFIRILLTSAIAAMLVGPISSATTFAATPTQVAQTAPQSTGGVNGVVKDNTGAPVAGATVRLEGKTSYSTISDATGAFSVTNVEAGFYTVSVTKAGYQTARESQFAVFTGETETLAVELHLATLTSLRTIARITSRSSTSLNTSTAAITNVSAQTFIDQGTPQVTRVLNQIPGVQISFPQSGSSGAVAGSITVPNIRGGASFETASLIDGHPLSVGTYGDYVTTFLSSYVLGGVETIKGPGAMAPQTNYAIGGTVNFRTKDPTYLPVADLLYGIDSHGGFASNFGFSDTVNNGRLGFVIDIANQDQPSALNNRTVAFDPTGAFLGNVNSAPQLNAFEGVSSSGGVQKGATLSGPYNGTASNIQSSYPLLATGYTISGDYNSTAELAKIKYNLSNSTSITASYLGSQSFADQNANTGNATQGFFTPQAGIGYNGAFSIGSAQLANYFHPGGNDREVNNEPIFQAEVHTTLGKDTVVGRFYHASIDRLINEGNSPTVPDVANLTLNGTSCNGSAYNFRSNSCTGATTVYSNAPVSLYYFDYFQQSEVDKLSGISFEYTHPIHDNEITLALDRTNSTTTSYSQGMGFSGRLNNPSVSIPTGSAQIFTTALLRGRFVINPKITATWSNYLNTYQSTYATSCALSYPKFCAPDGNGYSFSTTTNKHLDSRLGIEYRPNQNSAFRFAAGSGIAPPYLLLLSQIQANTATYSSANGYATLASNNGAIKPETSFGYDLGASVRLKDHISVVSGDVYATNLFNHFFAQTYASPYTCGTLPAGTACQNAGFTPATPVYYSSFVNLNNARFEGIELDFRHEPEFGFGYSLSGSMQKAYIYNLPAGFYCTSPGPGCTLNQNLNIISGQQINGGGIGYGSSIGSMNTRLPYAQGNLSLDYHWKNGMYAQFGDTYFGNNNSLNEPPFALASLSVRVPISKKIAFQVSGDNVFNAYSGVFPLYGGGVPIQLANGLQAATVGNVLGPATYRFMVVFNQK